MSEVVVNMVEEKEQFAPGDFFRWECNGDLCILVKTGGASDLWNLIPITKKYHKAFADSWEWKTSSVQEKIRKKEIVRLPKGFSVTIIQE